MISIAAQGLDVAAIKADIMQSVEHKQRHGVYAAAGLNSDNMKASLSFDSHAAFMAHFLDALRDCAFVDIADFEIIERRVRFTRPLVWLKKVIWSLLRFYTFRLWSQQNQVNGLLLAAIEGLQQEQTEQLAALEKRIESLERLTTPPPTS